MLQTVQQDLKRGRKEAKQDALEFVESEWFEAICDGAGMDPRLARQEFQKEKR